MTPDERELPRSGSINEPPGSNVLGRKLSDFVDKPEMPPAIPGGLGDGRNELGRKSLPPLSGQDMGRQRDPDEMEDELEQMKEEGDVTSVRRKHR